ncbi:hypothetical protein M9H77_12609 [Catharanthus roseus]|uniref:Uncharacterized protein n=1 Tax=Catharanthus roseus TaxID=4058 RepID=A0ACC0BHT6_CATRO|nr:hypothetical protein M9H77_12609 [Catharanthus roseus]
MGIVWILIFAQVGIMYDLGVGKKSTLEKIEESADLDPAKTDYAARVFGLDQTALRVQFVPLKRVGLFVEDPSTYAKAFLWFAIKTNLYLFVVKPKNKGLGLIQN